MPAVNQQEIKNMSMENIPKVEDRNVLIAKREGNLAKDRINSMLERIEKAGPREKALIARTMSSLNGVFDDLATSPEWREALIEFKR